MINVIFKIALAILGLGIAIGGYLYLEQSKADPLQEVLTEIKKNPLRERSSNIEVRAVEDVKIYDVDEKTDRLEIVYGNYLIETDEREIFDTEYQEKLAKLNITIESTLTGFRIKYQDTELPIYVK